MYVIDIFFHLIMKAGQPLYNTCQPIFIRLCLSDCIVYDSKANNCQQQQHKTYVDLSQLKVKQF